MIQNKRHKLRQDYILKSVSLVIKVAVVWTFDNLFQTEDENRPKFRNVNM